MLLDDDSEAIKAIAFSSSGENMIAASTDGTVRIWREKNELDED
jgi:WD40 repeat protein